MAAAALDSPSPHAKRRESDGCLVAPAVFKTVGSSSAAPVGSIPSLSAPLLRGVRAFPFMRFMGCEDLEFGAFQVGAYRTPSDLDGFVPSHHGGSGGDQRQV